MTRKQALSQAISILSQNDEYNEITEKLIEIESEMPLCRWTKKSIIDRIETYAEENNNILPLVSDLTKDNNMPSKTSISYHFNTNSIDLFFKEYFPKYNTKDKRNMSSSPYKNMSVKMLIDIFSSNYDRILKTKNVFYVDTKMYDKYREKNTPSLITIIKACGCKTYKDLLILCGYKNDMKLKCCLNYIDVDEEHNNDELKNVIKKIVNDLNIKT